MTIAWTMILRRASGPALLAILSLTLIGCNNVQIGWTMSYDGSLDGRTPASFEVACAETGGILLEAEENAENQTESKCTAANGDWFACDWAAQRCTAECTSTEQACTRLRYMGYVPLMLQKTPTPTAGTNLTSSDAFAGL